MELILKEKRRPHVWYFDDGYYISMNGDKVINKIKGEFLPNPEEINSRRKEMQATLPKSRRGLYRTQADPVTIALWNDWQARQNSLE